LPTQERVVRTVVVSGAGTGIGRAIAHRFAEAGDRVLLLGRREDRLRAVARELDRSGDGAEPPAVPIVGDVAEPAFVERLARRMDGWGDGRIDVLVNNAGGVVVGPESNLAEIAENWLATYRSNVLTAVTLTEGLAGRLRQPGARIVNLSSIAAYRGGGGAYSAAKAAITGWTFDLAARFGASGVTANVVVPGYIEGTEFFGTRMTPARHDRLVAQTLDGRAGRPEDVAAAVFFLASTEASHLTGQVVHVNGGALFGR
jgi:3-oxoacyl-[acyl-carrier protein] reductase